MKNFNNNTLTRISPVKRALRMVALLCVLLGFSSSAWGSYYFYQTSQDNWCSASGTWITPTQNGNIYTATATITEKGKNYYFWISTKKDDKCSIQSKDQVWITDEKPTSNISGVTCMRQKEWGCDPCSRGSNTNAHGFYIYSDVANIDILITADFTDVKNIKLSISKPVEPYKLIDELILTRKENYDENSNRVKFYGYLINNPQPKGSTCDNMISYGFAYTEVATSNKVCNAPEPTTSNAKYINLGKVDEKLLRGTEFIGELNNLGSDKSIAYRAYAQIDGKKYFSNWRCFTTKPCANVIPDDNSDITVYVDAISEADSTYYDDCELRYGNLQRAINSIKKNSKITTSDANHNYTLKRNVTIVVSQFDNITADGKVETSKGTYRGVKRKVSGGDFGGSRELYVNAIENINSTTTNGEGYTLTIKANNGDNPRIQHVLIRNSHNIVLDGINMISDPKEGSGGATDMTFDTALEIDNGRYDSFHDAKIDENVYNNIVIKNCRVGSNGFTGVHINSSRGITFENNILNMIFSVDPTNTNEYNNALWWGASIKLLECDQIKFIRNNIFGAQATLAWIQQTKNTLFYNNVFWNTNEFNKNGCVAVRVYDQFSGKTACNNIAVLYNTYYLADDETSEGEKKNYDFLYFGVDANAKDVNGNGVGSFEIGADKKIYFQYNNCYSYDKTMQGKSTTFANMLNGSYDKTQLCPNNFWSEYDEVKSSKGKSVYDIDLGNCTTRLFINIPNLVCQTEATGPSSLVIKNPTSGSLKVGTALTASDINTKAGLTNSKVALTSDESLYDRYKAGIRAKTTDPNPKWTLGALEATDGEFVEEIYWVGGVSNVWDNRNNWEYYPQNGARAKGRTLTCVDILSPELRIIIPEQGSAKYPTTSTGTYFYPQIPDNFDPADREAKTGIVESEQVSASPRANEDEPKRFAKSIELEYGAALKGVENLQNGDLHYDMGITNMTMQREQWVLVGPIVKPFKSGESGETRSIVSNDYYLDKKPNVYMKKIDFSSEGDSYNYSWGNPFVSLEAEVNEHTAYAVNIPDSYTDSKKSAKSYYKKNPDPSLPDNGVTDGTVAKSFKPMKGRFVNESSLPVYKFKSTEAYLLNNSYPANISAKKLQGDSNANGTVYLYDYSANSFKPVDTEITDAYIKPQHAFIFKPTLAEDFHVTTEMLADGDTKSRSAVAQTPALAINLYAGYINSSNHSTIYVKHTDSGIDGIVDSPLNAPKVFSLSDENTPELYLLANDDRFARLCIGGKEQTLPLGIRLQKPMYVVFAKNYNKNFTKVMLLDTETGKEYNLLEKSHTVDILPVGETEGRFFLNVAVAADDYVEDDDVPTNVEDLTDSKAINIYVDTNNDHLVRVITNNVELKHILVSDLMGRTLQYMASGNSANIELTGNKGIYIIQVVGENATRTEKVIVK